MTSAADVIGACLRLCIAALGAAVLSGCSGDSLEVFGGPTMGSTYSVKYVRASDGPSVDALRAETEAILADLDAAVSTYRDDSSIQAFNRLPVGQCVPVPESVVTLTRAGMELSQESGGALDLTLKPLLDLWGFGPKGRVERPPTEAQVRQVLDEQIGLAHLHLEGDRLCKDAPVALDFNSIAAGYAVDQVARRLEALGIDRYLVEITGELKAQGRKPDGSAWRIAIEAPHDDERVAQRIVSLDGLAVSTSGDYRNYYEQDGRRLSHTLDPSTGAPVTHRLASVTVAHPSALQADGLSTVLMVMGPEKGFDFAQSQGIAALFVVRGETDFETMHTEAFDTLLGEGGES